jgi:hypothetical protein
MAVDIDLLRQDLRLTADREGWADEEIKEIGADIRAALDEGNDDRLGYWTARLAWWRELLASYAPRLRAFESRIKAQRRAD